MKIRTIITAAVLMCMIAQGTVAVNAQSLSGRAEDMRHKILKTFHKRVYNHEYPLREIPVETSPNAHQTRKSLGRTASFTDRVWFPGEWEEVKAIMVTPFYDYRVSGHEDEAEWYADPVVGGYADYYHYKESDDW
jgi:hypothetical protein